MTELGEETISYQMQASGLSNVRMPLLKAK